MPLSGGEIAFRVFTPDSYDTGSDSYPVLYLQDGQNIFTDEEAVDGHSWQFRNYYQKFRKFLPDVIIVAVDCPPSNELRTSFYIPFSRDFAGVGSTAYDGTVLGKGGDYISWIIEDLKPWIDRNYRTIPDAKFTAIGGDSSAGVLSLYAVVRHPLVFSRFLSLSGAFYIWYDFLEKEIDVSDFSIEYCYLDVGGRDQGRITNPEQFGEGNRLVYDKLVGLGFSERQICYKVFPADNHSNYCFGRRFPDALRWIFQDCIEKHS